MKDASGRTLYTPQTDAWKIVVADGIEGLAGGILAGPVGALIGMAAGSLTMWVGLI